MMLNRDTDSDSEPASPAPALPSSSSSVSSDVLVFFDHLIGRSLNFVLLANGNLQSPVQLRAQIKHPLELVKAAACFFRSPGMEWHGEKLPPTLGHMQSEVFPFVLVRLMCGCVATACRRIVSGPADMYVNPKTTWRWAGWIMERVTRGRVSRVQVRIGAHAVLFSSYQISRALCV